MTIGERVTKAREAAGLTIAELARRVGISRSAIGQIENGMTKSPTAENLQRISDETKVPFKWLLTGKGQMLSEGLTNPPDVNDSDTSDAQNTGVVEVEMICSPTEAALLEAYRELDQATQDRVRARVLELALRSMKTKQSFPKRRAQ